MEISGKLYENDSYMKNFTAVVLSCVPDGDSFQVIVDKSAFFPEGGGQNADTGFLGDVRVLDVQEKGGTVYHKTDRPLEVGASVEGEIDWEKRFSNMQQHSGEHIVSGIVHRKYGYDNVGFHLGDENVTLDFNGPLTKDDLVWIERAANKAVFENRAITVAYPSADELVSLTYRSKIEIDGQVRIVTVDGYDVCACCAPHVARTGEIGLIKITNCQSYKGGVRLNILCGFRALSDYAKKQESIGKISAQLSVKPEEADGAVKKLGQDMYDLKGRLMALQEKLMSEKIKSLPADCANVCIFADELDASAMRRAVNQMTECHEGFCGIFVGSDSEGYRYNIGSCGQDAREMSKLLAQAGSLKGGGSPEMIQGRIQAKKAAIETVFTEERGLLCQSQKKA